MIHFSPPFLNRNIELQMIETLQSGWITSGKKVKEFESELMKFTNAKNVLCVNSWTSGALLVYKWLDIKKGDEVIVPAYTYSATALSVLNCGAKPVMVDVNSDFSINIESLKKAITNKTKAIIPVDFAGWPCDYDKIHEIVNDQKIRLLYNPSSEKQKQIGRIIVIADAAHSIGATYKNKNVGELTDITIFSFHAVKNITTGEGGAICLNLPNQFNNSEEFKLMKLLSLNGQTKDALSKSIQGNWKYDIIHQGLKVNMPDICAVIGLEQLKIYKDFLLNRREEIAQMYNDYFSRHDYFELPPLKDNERKSSFHVYALRINNCNESTRDSIIKEISSHNISVNVHFTPMPLLTLFKNLGYDILDYPISYDNYSREISLPIYPQLTNEQVEYVCDIVNKSYMKIVLN